MGQLRKMDRKSYFKGTYFRKNYVNEPRKITKLLSQDSWIPSRESKDGDLEGLWGGGGVITHPPFLILCSKIYDSWHRLLIISFNRFISSGQMKTNGRCVSKFVHKGKIVYLCLYVCKMHLHNCGRDL